MSKTYMQVRQRRLVQPELLLSQGAPVVVDAQYSRRLDKSSSNITTLSKSAHEPPGAWNFTLLVGCCTADCEAYRRSGLLPAGT
jgi:hypothetical protein